MSTTLASWSKNTLAVIAAAVGACGGAPHEPLPPPEVSNAITHRGETVYFGSVFPLGAPTGAPPTYVYERRVAEEGGAWISTHVTRSPSGELVLVESAAHSKDYALSEYSLFANQLGQSGSVRVEGDQIHFRLVDAGSEQLRTERVTAPVLVGPTLVGYMVTHLERIESGEAFPIRMAILDRMETLGFELTSAPGEPGQIRVRMKPSSMLVGLLVDPIDFTFDRASRKLVRLEGRVPPKAWGGGRWRDFDARVEYRFVSTEYR